MRWRELLDAYADWMDRLVGPLTNDPPSPERAKPDNPQASPWDAHDDYIATILEETPVTTPEPPLDELDQTARNYLAHPGAQRQTAWLIVDRLNQERKRLHRELAEAQLELAEARRPVHSPGWYRTMTTDAATERYGFPAPDCYLLEHTATDGSKWFLDQGGKGWTLSEYMDDDTHLLKVWEQNLLDDARVLAGGMEQERTVLTPDGMRIVVVTGDELDRLAAEIRAEATVVDAQVHEDCCGEHGTPTGLRWAADEVEQSMRDEWENAPQLADRIRRHADKVERQTTRERERVEKIVLRQWETAARATVDAALASLGEVVGVDLDNPAPEYDVAGFWATLTAEQQAEALAPALELYRAGRDDQKADHA